ncbi:hypothetical protein [Mastigocoleus testarum]|uniref:Uncharacterized protein n=1 Tax=Mastigocoleus testarum BC008 TaxID=371196 RepID=A0A0V7ZJE2_9CYAN|nr:hypothetical protein [Mastigocoleus testarum]KST64524.1 hypothetical protein BC008_18010 [Mastigocoleus testarum BC008]
MKNSSLVGWSLVIASSLFILLITGLIFYVGVNEQTIRTVLRFTSVTSVVPFLLVFVSKPCSYIQRLQEYSLWIENYRRYLWLILSISHLVHLFGIFVFVQLRVKQVPGYIWFTGGIAYLIIMIFAVMELVNSSIFDEVSKGVSDSFSKLIYVSGIWYIWLYFLFAYVGAASGYSPLTKGRQLFYTIPAAIIFIATALLHVLVRIRYKKLDSLSSE